MSRCIPKKMSSYPGLICYYISLLFSATLIVSIQGQLSPDTAKDRQVSTICYQQLLVLVVVTFQISRLYYYCCSSTLWKFRKGYLSLSQTTGDGDCGTSLEERVVVVCSVYLEAQNNMWWEIENKLTKYNNNRCL